jgi:hypothetical protein
MNFFLQPNIQICEPSYAHVYIHLYFILTILFHHINPQDNYEKLHHMQQNPIIVDIFLV